MADITLAEYNGRAWLVGGEEHIDDLLANTLAPDITIERVSCDSKSEVNALWVQNCGKPDHASDPWMIHPAIVDRTRRRSPDHAVFFAQWSALLDHDALAVVRAAAAIALQNPQQPVKVAEYIDANGKRSIADLSRLRAGLVEDALVTAGVDASRIERIARPFSDLDGVGAECQRVDIVVAPA